MFESKNIAYKKSNLTLIAENCELRSKLLKVQESCKEDIRQLKCSNKKLKSDLDDLEFVYSHTLREVKELERQSLRKNSKIAELTHSRTAVLNTGIDNGNFFFSLFFWSFDTIQDVGFIFDFFRWEKENRFYQSSSSGDIKAVEGTGEVSK